MRAWRSGTRPVEADGLYTVEWTLINDLAAAARDADMLRYTAVSQRAYRAHGRREPRPVTLLVYLGVLIDLVILEQLGHAPSRSEALNIAGSIWPSWSEIWGADRAILDRIVVFSCNVHNPDEAKKMDSVHMVPSMTVTLGVLLRQGRHDLVQFKPELAAWCEQHRTTLIEIHAVDNT